MRDYLLQFLISSIRKGPHMNSFTVDTSDPGVGNMSRHKAGMAVVTIACKSSQCAVISMCRIPCLVLVLITIQLVFFGLYCNVNCLNSCFR